MPYRQNRHLPDRVKNVLPEAAQSIWRRAFNAAADEHGDDDESRLIRIAWGAVRNAGYRKGDEGMWMMMEKLAESKEIFKAHSGIWIGCQVSAEMAQQIAVRNGEPADALHLTILYIRDAASLGAIGIGKVLGIVASLAKTFPPIEGAISGVGRFHASPTSDGKDVFVALYDSPHLGSIREQLINGLAASDIQPSQAHGYQPHISLAYLDPGQRDPRYNPETIPLSFDTLLVRWPDGEEQYRLSAPLFKRSEDAMPFIIKTAKQRYTLGIVYEPDVLDTDEEYAGAEVIQRACWTFAQKLQGKNQAVKQACTVIEAIGKALRNPEGVRLDVTELLEVVSKGRLGDQHSSWDDAYGDIVEIYCAPCDMQLGEETIKAGTWLMGVIWSPEQFAKIEAGERRGYSMGGVGRSEYREALGHA